MISNRFHWQVRLQFHGLKTFISKGKDQIIQPFDSIADLLFYI